MKKKKKEKFEKFRSFEKNAFKTVKITLNNIIKDSKTKSKIETLVRDINDLVIHTYQFIRLYILNLYHNNLDFPVINEHFIGSVIKTLGTKDNRGAKRKDDILPEKLEQFYNQEYQPLLNHQKTDLRNKTHMTPYITTQIFTCLSNNIQEHFIQHIKRFINVITQDITKDKSILFHFKNKLLFLEETDDIFKDWLLIHKSNILPSDIKKSVHYDLEVSPFKYIKCLLYMNEVLENHVQENGSKTRLFQPLPLRTSVIPKHIILDTSAIVELFCPKDLKKGVFLSNIKDNKDLIWSFILRRRKVFKDPNYVFHGQIQTDGISCSLLFIRNDLKDKKWGSKLPKVPNQEFHLVEELSEEYCDTLKDRNIIGCDPGKRSLVYMIDSKGNKLQYTSPQRMVESKSKCNKRILLKERKENGLVILETDFSKYNSKTVNYDKFKEYLVQKDILNKQTQDFYQRDTWRKMKFRSYSYGRKSVDKFLNKIKDTYGPNILIGYGNWSRSTQMKYIEPTMNKGFRKLIHKRFDTITINEHNTSKKCCDCHKDLSHHRDSKNKEIFRLLKCSDCVSSENKKIVFRTRDVNSAVNIRKITSDWIFNQKRLPVFCITANENRPSQNNESNSEKEETIISRRE